MNVEKNRELSEKKVSWSNINVGIIIYLVTIIIFILMIRLGDNQGVVETIGFGGTMVSIILGVIAIIYPMIQNDNMSNTNIKMVNSAETIKEVTIQLSELICGISDDNKYIRDNTDKLKDKTEKIADMLLIAKEVDGSINENISQVGKLTDLEINKILKKLPKYIIYSLYYLYNLACFEKKEDIHKFSDYCRENRIRLTNFNIIMSTATILYSLDIIEKIVFVNDPTRVGINISDNNKKIIKDFCDEYKHNYVPGIDPFDLNNIDTYFSISC